LAIVAITIGAASAAGSAYYLWSSSRFTSIANDRVYICSETGKSFHVDLASLHGQVIPIYSPYSHKNTGFPAELCYWTADGKPKSDPTPVLLKELIGAPGPTFCPDCGRLVVPHNPAAVPGAKPPPTKQQWEERQNRRGK